MSTCPYPVSQIDKYRDIAVIHGDWSVCIKSDFDHRMLDIGVFVEGVLYDVSYCQGSGACFEGFIFDWGKYLLHLGYDNPILASAAQGWQMSWKHGGRYCHEYSLTYDENLWANINPYDEVEQTLKFDMWANVMNTFDLFRLSNDIKEDLRGHMKALHRTLVAEYEHLTSDEVVSDWMRSNEIELTELEN
jgi:hypothetical protein